MLPWIAVLATAAILSWALARAWRLAAVGSAYRSKVLCTIVFESRRSVDPQRVEDVSQDSYRPLRLFRSRIDPAAHTVTTSLFGLRPRIATYREGLGATLFLSEGRASPEASLKARTTPGSSADLHVRPSRAVQRVVDAAFTEPNAKRRRRTRAVVVVRDGEIVAEQYAAGFDAAMPLPGWSMAKSVLNAFIGILVGEKRLSLKDTAVWPQWPA